MKKLLILLMGAVLTLCVFAACTEKTPLTPPTNITYDGQQITWDGVKDAVGYELIIDEGDAISVTTNKYSFDAKDKEFTVSVKAKHKKEELSSSGETINFKPLGKTANVRYEEGVLVWDRVENATGYLVKVNNVIDKTPVTINEYTGLKEGAYGVQVRAIKTEDSSYYSCWSDLANFKLLDCPKNLSYNKETDTITWDAVRDSSGYILKINGIELEQTSGTSLKHVVETHGDLKLEVRAVSTKANVFDSGFSDAETYSFLKPITDISAKNGEIIWSEIGEGSKYQVLLTENNIQKNPVVVDNAKYSNLKAGIDYTIKVRAFPKNDREFSVYSNAIKFRFLSAPTVAVNETSNETQIGFDIKATNNETTMIEKFNMLITDASGKEWVNQTVAASYSEFEFEAAGEYRVEVQAVPKSNLGYYSFESKYSAPIKVVRLASVSKSSIKLNRTSTGYEMRFNAVEGAPSGYSYSVGTVLASSASSNSFALPALETIVVGKTAISIMTKGTKSSYNGKYYLNSKAETTDVTKLATPTELQVNGGVLTWGEIPNQKGYDVSVGGVKTGWSNTNYALSGISAGAYEIKVMAKGDANAFYMDSDFSDVYNIRKLDTPIVTEIDRVGLIKWNSVNNVERYKISYGADNEEISGSLNSFDISEKINTTSPTTIKVTAVGNNGNILDSEPSSSVYAKKLATPGRVELVNSSKIINWNKTSDDKSYYVQLLKNSTPMDGTTVNVNNYSTDSIGQGEWTLTVISNWYKGENNTYYVESDVASLPITKLKTVENLMRADGSNRYTWTQNIKASGYSISIPNRDPQKISENFYEPEFKKTDITANGIKIQLKVLGDDNAGIIDSDITEFMQKVMQIKTPSLTAVERTDSGFKLTAGNTSGVIAKYVFNINNINQADQDREVFNFDASAPSEYKFSVSLRGGLFTNDIYYLNSENCATITKTLLKPVKDLKYVYNQSANSVSLTWVLPDSNGNGTEIIATKQDGTAVQITDKEQSSATLSGFNSGDTITVKVHIKGDNSNKFDSATTEITIIIP